MVAAAAGVEAAVKGLDDVGAQGGARILTQSRRRGETHSRQ